jgi:iron-sulfur cluster assembly accessory protein
MSSRPPMISLTKNAVERVKDLVSKSSEPVLGLRIGVSSRGCSGLSYSVEYASEAKRFEEVIEQDGVKVLIDPAAVMFLIGSVVDYEESRFTSGFTFNNPNAVGACGCGESFYVEKDALAAQHNKI